MSNVRHLWLMKIRPAYIASFLKKVLLIKRKVINTGNGKFYIDPLSGFGQGVLSEENYEPELTKVIKEILIKGDTFVDIGANEGYFSIIASKVVGSDGRVISVEPQTRLQPILFKNMALNKAYNMEVFQRALSDEVNFAELSLLPDMNTGGSGIFNIAKYKCPTELVPQTPLSIFLRSLNIGKIKLIKMDVESFEYEIILGSKKVFEDGLIQNIALELHPTILEARGRNQDHILNFLTSCGYQINSKFNTLVLTRF